MKVWKMQVFLTRDLRGDDEHQQVRLALPSMTAVGYQTGRREASLYIYVEACTRNEAETVARKAVEAVLGPDEIERVGGADDTMQNRQMMLWIRGTLRQVRRWEIALAVNIRAQLANQSPEPHEIWDAQIERHLALVAANNLLRAIDNADGRFTTMPGDMARDIRNQRDLQEHWDEQWPAFYNSTKPGPLKRGGTVFAASYPGSSPYSFLGWSNATGPKLGPGLLAADLYTYLDQVESEVLAVAPDLARFVSEVDASPWVGDEHPTDPWWPK